MTRNQIQQTQAPASSPAASRSQVESRQTPPAAATADLESRLSSIEEDLRELNGKTARLEYQMNQSQNENSATLNLEQNKNIESLQIQVKALQEEVIKLNGQLSQVESSASRPTASNNAKPAAKKNADLFDEAEESFQAKDWKKAILTYQKFREKNPKSGKVPEATYKIGVAFQELGMKDEAKTFYDEVVEKHPNSVEARKSKTRLKSLKK